MHRKQYSKIVNYLLNKIPAITVMINQIDLIKNFFKEISKVYKTLSY